MLCIVHGRGQQEAIYTLCTSAVDDDDDDDDVSPRGGRVMCRTNANGFFAPKRETERELRNG